MDPLASIRGKRIAAPDEIIDDLEFANRVCEVTDRVRPVRGEPERAFQRRLKHQIDVATDYAVDRRRALRFAEGS